MPLFTSRSNGQSKAKPVTKLDTIQEHHAHYSGNGSNYLEETELQKIISDLAAKHEKLLELERKLLSIESSFENSDTNLRPRNRYTHYIPRQKAWTFSPLDSTTTTHRYQEAPEYQPWRQYLKQKNTTSSKFDQQQGKFDKGVQYSKRYLSNDYPTSVIGDNSSARSSSLMNENRFLKEELKIYKHQLQSTMAMLESAINCLRDCKQAEEAWKCKYMENCDHFRRIYLDFARSHNNFM